MLAAKTEAMESPRVEKIRNADPSQGKLPTRCHYICHGEDDERHERNNDDRAVDVKKVVGDDDHTSWFEDIIYFPLGGGWVDVHRTCYAANDLVEHYQAHKQLKIVLALKYPNRDHDENNDH
jgi:hypothetical protein